MPCGAGAEVPGVDEVLSGSVWIFGKVELFGAGIVAAYKDFRRELGVLYQQIQAGAYAYSAACACIIQAVGTIPVKGLPVRCMAPLGAWAACARELVFVIAGIHEHCPADLG
jgi:hypothetical protein